MWSFNVLEKLQVDMPIGRRIFKERKLSMGFSFSEDLYFLEY